MKVLVNAISAKMGGAQAYLKNFLPTLSSMGLADEFTVFVPARAAADLRGLTGNIHVQTMPAGEGGELSRIYFDQWTLRRMARKTGADCIFSTANFGILYPPVPQVISVRNSVFFSRRYYAHVKAVEGRLAAAKIAARRRMVALSARSSDVVVTPTEAMRDMMLEWGAADPAKCVVIHHGFDRESFLAMGATQGVLDDTLARRGDEKMLFYPSLYGKHKNFDTLIEALAILLGRGYNVRLFLTCDVRPSADRYQRRTWSLIEKHNLRGKVILYGPVPYQLMPRIYRGADVVVWPSFAESFGHPLLEAMASGRPIVASGIASNAEIARDAAVYFDTFSAEDLADKVVLALREDVRKRLVKAGAARVGEFSWRRHVEEFIAVFRRLAEKNG